PRGPGRLRGRRARLFAHAGRHAGRRLRVAPAAHRGVRSQPAPALRRGQHPLLRRRQASLALLQGDGLQQVRHLTQRTALRLLTAAYLASLAGFVLLGGAGCGSCGEPSGGQEAGAAALTPEPPVPAPSGLLAEAWIHAPDSAWGEIQRGVSGAVALLPPTV